MKVKTSSKLKKLYEIDDYLWLQETIKLLKQENLGELDLDNLIEELEDLGRERKNKVQSLLRQIIIHLLLLEYWESEFQLNASHWEAEITEFRTQLNNTLTTNLKIYLDRELEKIYQDALRYVKRKTRLDIFPQQCKYDLEELLNQDWFPEN